jgi:pyruvate formate lyase activating enzyme
MTAMVSHPARFWHARGDGRIECDLCPRRCKLQEGQRAFCFVRMRQGDRMVLTTWGRSTGFHKDPIEKKPLYHFLPGSSALSFGTVGCNLGCRFCQNWHMSKSREQQALVAEATPAEVAEAAVDRRCASVAYTYNDPVIAAEYVIDTAVACHRRGIANVAVTSGFVSAEARAEFFAPIDAANVDLKAFHDDFYRRVCLSKPGGLRDVLDTLRWLAHEGRVWVELTTLLIPGYNDSDDELRRMCEWIRAELGAGVPIHFSAFHPSFRMLDVPATPPDTCRRAREIARETGLHYAYTGNIHDPEGQTTYCPGCGAAAVERTGFLVRRRHLTAQGACGRCATPIAGVFRWPAAPAGA